MIFDAILEKTIYHAPPARCEAGTGDIADAVGVAAAFDDVEAIGMENVTRHEHDLLIDAMHGLKCIPGLGLIGTVKEEAAVLSSWTDSRPRKWVRASIAKPSRCAAATAARSPPCVGLAWRRQCGHRWRITTALTMRMRCWPR